MAVESFNRFSAIPEGFVRRTSRRSQAVFEALQKDIVLGVLLPEIALTELELAEKFGCSQGTVREALLALHEEGLVIRQPNRGTHVAPCNAADAHALLRIRRDVECGFLERVVRNSDPELEAELGSLLNGMRNAARDSDEYALSVFDRAFHARLFRAADLPPVEPILNRCLIHSHRFKILKSPNNRELEATAERHVPILTALQDGDVSTLRDLLSHHISTIVDFGPDLSSAELPE